MKTYRRGSRASNDELLHLEEIPYCFSGAANNPGVGEYDPFDGSAGKHEANMSY